MARYCIEQLFDLRLHLIHRVTDPDHRSCHIEESSLRNASHLELGSKRL